MLVKKKQREGTRELEIEREIEREKLRERALRRPFTRNVMYRKTKAYKDKVQKMTNFSNRFP